MTPEIKNMIDEAIEMLLDIYGRQKEGQLVEMTFEEAVGSFIRTAYTQGRIDQLRGVEIDEQK